MDDQQNQPPVPSTQPLTGDSQSTPPPPPVASKLKEQVPPAPPMPTLSSEEARVHDTTEADKVAKKEGDEYWQRFAREIELEKEVAEMGGVEKIERGEVPLPKEIAGEMGIEPAVTIETPIEKATSAFAVRGTALTDDQLTTGQRQPITSAFRWLVEWFILQLKKAHYLLKVVKGKIVRQATNP